MGDAVYPDERSSRRSYSRRSPSARSRSRSPRRGYRERSYSPRRDPYARRSYSPPARSPRDYTDIDMDRSSSYRGGRAGYGAGGGAPYDPHKKAMNREVAAQEAAKRSHKENRVYVGNLAFSVRWNDLKDFMRDAGDVVFADILTLPNGMSKGCGVVEYSNPEDAQRAIAELNDKTLMGRPLFIREDRENEARFGNAAVGGGRGGFEPRGGRGGGAFGGPPRGGAFGGPGSAPSKQLFVGGLNWEVGWQDLKDLFRQAGDIMRADIHYGSDGNPKGSGTVVFNNPYDAQAAITMFNGAELNGMKLDVREERFSVPTTGPFGSGTFVGRGGSPGAGGSPGRGGYAPRGGRGGISTAPPPFQREIEPSNQIFVKNLPWSTSNDDLIELFQTVGTVEFAEVAHDGGRSKGVGVVQFFTTEDAQVSIQKFQGYEYGGRALNIEYNMRYRDFHSHPPTALEDANPSIAAPME